MGKTSKIVSAALAGILLSASSLMLPDAAQAASECLTAPKGPATSGGHWYYHLDRASKRKCWYIGDASKKSTHIAAKNSPSQDAPAQSAASQSSISDARAEYQDDAQTAPAQAAAPLSNPVNASAPAQGNADVNPTDTPAVAAATSPWPDPRATVAPASIQPAASVTASTDQAAPAAASAEPPTVVPAPQPTAQPVKADAYDWTTLALGAAAALLVLLGVLGYAMVRFGRAREIRSEEIPAHDIRNATMPVGMTPAGFGRGPAPKPRRVKRDHQPADPLDLEVRDLLSQTSGAPRGRRAG